ncbi:MAG: hypothetical protein A2087_08570 [Spirochaetes bacterium GWD1_61_31]|nr:MAG: hypothetical protein A2Y37_13245 [Spirochaetes bacterium GWB1_60_80]OHD35489.1 MAG: hypothetical protein A2004_08560 [Spirochaetes bacterium GWC1_61_12]OHD36725.1 MAG: hypothetical protein A2087_08570 [Spirochaetes bacterium GWD1_61_31]OHD42517.1 MAG: hypothetical protein A2Y35_08040 [Spirochaetes bacterium GWE1_60_18]OHD58245.1 MAG: hypothetical protein A2Y32_04960 [Spirochaetes bacterium GWF1_60_12]HAP44304.1 hypothetical protein [Spirochaetaceae bacterium]
MSGQADNNQSDQAALFKVITENLFDFITLTDLDGIIRYVGPSHRAFGYREDQLIGQPLLDFVHPADLAMVERALAEFRCDPQRNRSELRSRCADGGYLWLEVVGTLITDEAGTPTGMLYNSRDISQRKRTEERLRQTEQSYQAVFNTLSEAIYIIDQAGVFIEVNRGAELMYGLSRDQLVGLTPAEVGAPGHNDLLAVQALMNEVSLTGQATQFEFWGQRQNGEIFPKEVIVNRGFYFGQPVLIATARDITNSKLFETTLQRNLAEKNSLLKELYHRTKNNMQVISSIINLQTIKYRDPVLREALADVDQRIKSMSLVHQMLYKSSDLSRIDLRHYLEQLSTAVLKFYEMNSRVTRSIAGDSPRLLIDEAIPCGLIINELLTNSCKHGFPLPRLGAIQLQLRLTAPDRLTIQYSDDGRGLPADFDLDHSQSLGMVLLKSLAEHQLGGNLSIKSGNGVQVSITFPINTYQESVRA